jgi:hypothetical protein
MDPWIDNWSKPDAIEITVLQQCRRLHFHPDHLAQPVGALRNEYGPNGCRTKTPGPLHFGSFFKEYVPDYEMEDETMIPEDEEEN